MKMPRSLKTWSSLVALLMGGAGAQTADTLACPSSGLFVAGSPGHLIGTADTRLEPSLAAASAESLGQVWFQRYVKSWAPQRDAALFIVDLFQPTPAQEALNRESPERLDAWYAHGDLVLLHSLGLIEGSGQFELESNTGPQVVYRHKNGRRLYVRTVDLNANRSAEAQSFNVAALIDRLNVAYTRLNASSSGRPLHAVVNMSFSLIPCALVTGYNAAIRQSGKFIRFVDYEKGLLGQFRALQGLDPRVLEALRFQRNLFVNAAPGTSPTAPGQLARLLRGQGVLDRFIWPQNNLFPSLPWGSDLPPVLPGPSIPGGLTQPPAPGQLKTPLNILNQAGQQLSRLQTAPGLPQPTQQEVQRLLDEVSRLRQNIAPPAEPPQLSEPALTRALQYFNGYLTRSTLFGQAAADFREHLRTGAMATQRKVLVAASGNLRWPQPTLPAIWPEVLSVGGTAPGGSRRAAWSNGAEVLHRGEWFMFPQQALYMDTLDTTAEYIRALRYSGTSFAAPNVSVFLALDLMRDAATCVDLQPIPNTAVFLTAFHSRGTASPAGLPAKKYPDTLFHNVLSSCDPSGHAAWQGWATR